MNFLNLIRLAGETTTTTDTTSTGGGLMSLLMSFGMPILMVVLILLMYLPQRKKQKEEQKMRNNLRVGDELTTIGGIKGRVVMIKDDTVTIETSNDRTKIVFVKDAIGAVHTKHEDPIDDDDDDDDDI